MNNQGKSHGCLLIVLAFIIIVVGNVFLSKIYPMDDSTVSTSHTTKRVVGTTASTTEDDFNYDYGTRDNPIVITSENVSSLRPNTYVRITGPVCCLSSSTGQFTIGGGNQTYGLWIAIENSDGTICESVEVPSVNANGYEDEFNAHCEFDVRYYPETIGDRRYCGCTATIEGRYESYLAYVDGDYIEFYRLSSGSRIVDLSFYY